jgi:hypothetical protein
LRPKHDAALVRRAIRHRVERVHEQVEHDLLQLDPVTPHRRKAGAVSTTTRLRRRMASLWTSRTTSRMM